MLAIVCVADKVVYVGMFVFVEGKGCEVFKWFAQWSSCSVWADPLVMEYFNSTKLRELSLQFLCWSSFPWASCTQRSALPGIPEVCGTFMNKNTQYFGTVYGCIKSKATRCWKKQPNLDGTCSLQTSGHTIFHETSQEIKSRHFP